MCIVIKTRHICNVSKYFDKFYQKQIDENPCNETDTTCCASMESRVTCSHSATFLIDGIALQKPPLQKLTSNIW